MPVALPRAIKIIVPVAPPRVLDDDDNDNDNDDDHEFEFKVLGLETQGPTAATTTNSNVQCSITAAQDYSI